MALLTPDQVNGEPDSSPVSGSGPAPGPPSVWRRRLVYYGILILIVILSRSPGLRVLVGLVSPGAGMDVQKAFRDNTQGFVILLAAAVYLDVVSGWGREQVEQAKAIRLDQRLDAIEAQLRDRELSQWSNDGLVNAALKRRYGATASIDNLTATVLSSRPPLLNAVIEHNLSDHPTDPLRYLLHRSETFACPEMHSEFLVALTSLTGVADLLLSLCPRICDFWTVPGQSEVEEVSLMLVDRASVRVTVERPNGVTETVTARFQLVAEPAKADMLDDAPDEIRASVRLFSAPLPKGVRIVQYRVDTQLVLSRARRMTYWTADRAMFVNRIAFNVHRLVAPNVEFRIVPFLATNGSLDNGEGVQGIYYVEPSNWLVKGQGVALVWNDQPERDGSLWTEAITGVAKDNEGGPREG